MIVPQLETGRHGADVKGMFFLWDNALLLVKGNDIGERLNKISEKNSMLLMACDQCAYERNIANNLVVNAKIGCFPDLYKTLGNINIDQVITL
jgi:hypothetical protein